MTCFKYSLPGRGRGNTGDDTKTKINYLVNEILIGLNGKSDDIYSTLLLWIHFLSVIYVKLSIRNPGSSSLLVTINILLVQMNILGQENFFFLKPE